MSESDQNANRTTADATAIGSEVLRKRPYRLSSLDVAMLEEGWRRYVVVDRNTVRTGYLRTMASYFSKGDKTIGGVAVPTLLPQEQRPSLRQFSYWGTRASADRRHWQLRLRRIAPKPDDIQ